MNQIILLMMLYQVMALLYHHILELMFSIILKELIRNIEFLIKIIRKLYDLIEKKNVRNIAF